jgi:hypothetical protein
MKYLREVFQDIDGAYSFKRSAFLIVLLLLIVVTVAPMLRDFSNDVLAYLSKSQETLIALLTWLGGFIVAERAQKFAPGAAPPPQPPGGNPS